MTTIPSPAPPPLSRLDAAPDMRTALAIEKIALLLPVTEVSQGSDTRLDNRAIHHDRAESLGTRPADQQGQLPGTIATASRETLSAAARAIVDVIGHADDSPLRSAEPIVATPPGAQPTEALAQALRGAIENSGLFYESHLKEWADGSRPLAQLRQEPQGALPRPPVVAARAEPPVQVGAAVYLRSLPVALPTRTGTGAQTSHPQPPWAATGSASGLTSGLTSGPTSGPPSGSHHPQQAALAYLAMSSSGDGPALPRTAAAVHVTAHPAEAPMTAGASAAPPSAHETAASVHPDSAGLVRAQLEALASHQLHWKGEAWPGVALDWRIARDHVGDGNAADAGEARTWTTRLVLDLPALGKVEATLRLAPAGIDANLLAESPAMAERLSAQRGAFATRLSKAGLVLTALSVQASGSETESRP